MRVAWQEWTGDQWFDRITDPITQAKACEFDHFMRTQRAVSVRSVRIVEANQT